MEGQVYNKYTDLKNCSPATTFDAILNKIFLKTLIRADNDSQLNVSVCNKLYNSNNSIYTHTITSGKGSLKFFKKYEFQKGVFQIRYLLKLNPK